MNKKFFLFIVMTAIFAAIVSSCGKDGEDGKDGNDGKPGSVVTIGANGNWFIDGKDSGISAQGAVVTIGDNGNWFINGKDTGKSAVGAQGDKGDKGDTGSSVNIGANGNWFIDGVDTGVKAAGSVVTIGANGNWFINGVDTGVKAQCEHNNTGGSSSFDGTTIVAKVEYGNDYNKRFQWVETFIYDAFDYSDDSERLVIDLGPYSNGGFTVTLPTAIDDKHLFELDAHFDFDDMQVSSLNVKYTKIYEIKGCSYNNLSKGWFLYGKLHIEYLGQHYPRATYCEFWYVDKDVTITGDNGYEKWDVSLKKGWNMVYLTETYETKAAEYTTKVVEGMKWYWGDDFGA